MNSENSLRITISNSVLFCELFAAESLTPALTRRIQDGNGLEVLKKLFEEDAFHVLPENMNFIIENSNYQLIPSVLFSEQDINSILKLSFDVNEKQEYNVDILPKWGMHLVYWWNKEIQDYVEKNYEEADVKHHIFYFLKNVVYRNKSAVYLNMREGEIDIAFVSGNTLQLLNSYEVNASEDLCYFVLNVFDTFKLGTETTELKISGKSNKEAVELLKKYLVKISFDS